MAIVFSVVHNKGGVGKSTLAVHLACYLAQRGKTVLVDADQKNRSSQAWGENWNAAVGPCPFTVMTEKGLVRLSSDTEYIVFDTVAGASQDDYRELSNAADLLIMPINPEVMSVESTQRLMPKLRPLAGDKIILVMTKLPHTSMRKAAEIREVLASDAEMPPLANAMVRHFTAFQEAATMNVSVLELPRVKAGMVRAQAAWQDIEVLGAELLQRVAALQGARATSPVAPLAVTV